MSSSEQKIVQYLNEAHAMEQGLVRDLQAQIGMAPRGRFRKGLEQHLRETRGHSQRVRTRLNELNQSRNPVEFGIGLVQSVIAQAVAVGKTPLELLRGTGGDEKLLKNAKEACAAESLEIATYTALERLADSVGDRRTVELARSIRSDEEQMLERLLDELPQLTDGVVNSEIRGENSFALSETGAADKSRAVGRATKRTAKRTARRARRTAKRATSSAKRTATSAKGTTSRTARSKARRTGGTTGTGRKRSGAASGSSAAPRKRSGAASGRSTAARKRSGAAAGSSAAPRKRAGAASGRSTAARGRSGAAASGNSISEHAREPWRGYEGQNLENARAALSSASAERARRMHTDEEAADHSGVAEKPEHAFPVSGV
jgi:ferritin-like metal-binding protein YciE